MTTARPAPWVLPLALAPMLAQSLLDGFYKAPLYRWSATAFWWVDLAKFVFVPAAVLVCLARYGGMRPRNYGLAWPRTTAERETLLGNGLLASVVLVPLYFLTREMIGRAFPDVSPVEFGYETALPTLQVLRWLAIGYYAVSAGLIEEVVFRALPWAWCKGLRGKGVPAAYVLATSALFGLAHWENGAQDVFTATVFGLAAAALYLRLRNLWPIVAAHVITDVIAFS